MTISRILAPVLSLDDDLEVYFPDDNTLGNHFVSIDGDDCMYRLCIDAFDQVVTL